MPGRQEGYFKYLFGVTEEDYYGAINLDSQPPTAILFMPRLPESYAVWMGKIKQPFDKKQQYAVDEVEHLAGGSMHLASLPHFITLE